MVGAPVSGAMIVGRGAVVVVDVDVDVDGAAATGAGFFAPQAQPTNTSAHAPTTAMVRNVPTMLDTGTSLAGTG